MFWTKALRSSSDSRGGAAPAYSRDDERERAVRPAPSVTAACQNSTSGAQCTHAVHPSDDA
jgi:hypothetical protein